jgi:hypothetical protein
MLRFDKEYGYLYEIVWNGGKVWAIALLN